MQTERGFNLCTTQFVLTDFTLIKVTIYVYIYMYKVIIYYIFLEDRSHLVSPYNLPENVNNVMVSFYNLCSLYWHDVYLRINKRELFRGLESPWGEIGFVWTYIISTQNANLSSPENLFVPASGWLTKNSSCAQTSL